MHTIQKKLKIKMRTQYLFGEVYLRVANNLFEILLLYLANTILKTLINAINTVVHLKQQIIEKHFFFVDHSFN